MSSDRIDRAGGLTTIHQIEDVAELHDARAEEEADETRSGPCFDDNDNAPPR